MFTGTMAADVQATKFGYGATALETTALFLPEYFSLSPIRVILYFFCFSMCMQVHDLRIALLDTRALLGIGWLSGNLNTLRQRQDARHYPDDIFKCIFLNENAWILIKISLKFIP